MTLSSKDYEYHACRSEKRPVRSQLSQCAGAHAEMCGMVGLTVPSVRLLLALPASRVNFRPHFGAIEAARSHMNSFLRRIISGYGRIPTEVFIGPEKALERASERRQSLQSEGVDNFLCKKDILHGPQGAVHLRVLAGLFKQGRTQYGQR